MAAATLYRERFGDTPGIVYAAGVDHAYNLATAFRAAGIEAEAVSRVAHRPPSFAQILAAYERGEIDVLDQRDAAGRGLELAARDRSHAPCTDGVEARLSQRIGRIMRIHPRKEAGIVVDFVQRCDAQRARRLAALAARRRLLPRGRSRHAGSAAANAAARTA
jgi:superfamily II DNA or RNA helicase